MTAKPTAQGQRRHRRPRRMTPDRLHRIALHYLERYASSADNLRRVLMRRVERAARAHGSDRGEGAAMVEDLVARLAAAGILDDAAYARAKAQSQSRAGKSGRAIAHYLRAKGVDRSHIEATLEALETDGGDPELNAAIRYARRRRLGPWRLRDRAEQRERGLAAMGRRGFDYGTARAVIDRRTPSPCLRRWTAPPDAVSYNGSAVEYFTRLIEKRELTALMNGRRSNRVDTNRS